jgi:TRAP-type C4-dicarboxylate transport system permease small subunit
MALVLFLGILASGIWNTYNKRWSNALPNLFFSLAIIFVMLLIMG